MALGLTLKALADPTRRDIIKLLKEKDMTAGEIADCFTISKPSISHHLNILKQAGLIIDERQGQNIYYSLNTSVMEELIRWLMNVTRKEGGSADERNPD
ncbi:MAG: winged helix-turn-helix transcriptional regulator [Clostridia bacterium]|jgi:DNA-binding transcriptional ArsR family regulator|nr:winged helix-turn-helix transcriptional regulator [Clostridia bacterium]